ncbi:hypothetical protein CBM2634_B170185 [Cupriavidus taiwanensis]|uniref:Uncharacterized protein n=1 Tax=Cupriavidus taiwanensis TaxID=164546 RepID=A0A375J6R4_9BURK|nr:hypothetical protein CBM2634_B170185 [Cupriavidus taiwanensis]
MVPVPGPPIAAGRRSSRIRLPSSDLATPDARPCAASPPDTVTVVVYSAKNPCPRYLSSKVNGGGCNRSLSIIVSAYFV